jgi:hypothetical protein
LQDTLLEIQALEQAVDVETVFTDQFLDRIYADGELIWP